MLQRILWKIILVYVFIRPIISERIFSGLNLIIDLSFLLTAVLFLLYHKKATTTKLDLVILFFICNLILSLLFSLNVPGDFSKSLIEFTKYLSPILLFYAIRSSNLEEKETLFIALLLGNLIVFIIAMRGLFIIGPKILSEMPQLHLNKLSFARDFLLRKRAFSPFITPNLLANYLVIITTFILGFAIDKFKNSKKDFGFYFAAVMIPLNITLLFFTKSVGGWLTFAAVMAILFISLHNVKRKIIVATLISLIVTTSIVIGLRTKTNLSTNSPVVSLEKRVSYWKDTIEVIKKNPLTGTTIGNFRIRETLMAHNSYLQIWAELGIFGIITWLAIVFLCIKKGIKLFSLKRKNFFYAATFSAAAAFLIHNIVDFSFFIPQVSYLWWIMIGFIDIPTKKEIQLLNS